MRSDRGSPQRRRGTVPRVGGVARRGPSPRPTPSKKAGQRRRCRNNRPRQGPPAVSATWASRWDRILILSLPGVHDLTTRLFDRRNRVSLDTGTVGNPAEPTAQDQDEDHQRPDAQSGRVSMPPTPGERSLACDPSQNRTPMLRASGRGSSPHLYRPMIFFGCTRSRVEMAENKAILSTTPS